MTKKDLLTGDVLCETCDRRECICGKVAKAILQKNVENFEKIYQDELCKLLRLVVRDPIIHGTLLGVLLLRDHLESVRHPEKTDG